MAHVQCKLGVTRICGKELFDHVFRSSDLVMKLAKLETSSLGASLWPLELGLAFNLLVDLCSTVVLLFFLSFFLFSDQHIMGIQGYNNVSCTGTAVTLFDHAVDMLCYADTPRVTIFDYGRKVHGRCKYRSTKRKRKICNQNNKKLRQKYGQVGCVVKSKGTGTDWGD